MSNIEGSKIPRASRQGQYQSRFMSGRSVWIYGSLLALRSERKRPHLGSRYLSVDDNSIIVRPTFMLMTVSEEQEHLYPAPEVIGWTEPRDVVRVCGNDGDLANRQVLGESRHAHA
ncbi:hypothetical protein DENSPDRAFT_832341 [Dentipellis sp. KUC8613]|nr:hypothetical protein DENSPDRAFT_832341 [Dentipellis sp. KUC8613]